MSDQQVRNRIVEKMLRNRIVGGKNRTVDTVVNWTLPTHLQGQGRQLDDMVADPGADGFAWAELDIYPRPLE